MKRGWIFLAVFLSLSCAFTSKASAKTLTFNYGTASFLSLDVHASRSAGELRWLANTIFDNLIMHGSKMELQPMLATSWKSSQDATVWTLSLRKGVKFHDGTLFNADAVVFNFNRILDPKMRGYDFVFFNSLIKSVEAVDENTVTFTLKIPYAPFPAALTLPDAAMVSPAGVKKYGTDFKDHPVGSGPYKFKSWKREQELLVERNEDYWGGMPKVENVRVVLIRERGTMYAALKSGEIDVLPDPPGEFLKQLSADPSINVDQGGPKTFVEYIGFNCEKSPFNEKQVRLAVSHAINMKALVKEVIMEYGSQICQPISPIIWGYDPSIGCIEYNPPKAKEMLTAVGWKAGPDGVLEKDGKKFVIHAPIFGQQAPRYEAVQHDLKKVGIDLKVRFYEFGAFLGQLQQGTFDMFWIGRDYVSGDPDVVLYNLFHSSSAPYPNIARYKSAEADKLLELQRGELNEGKRLDLIHKLIRLVMGDMPIMPTFVRMTNTSTNKKVQNLYTYPDDRVDLLKVTVE